MTAISLIPVWPWLVLLISGVLVWVLWTSIRLNNKVRRARKEVLAALVEDWMDDDDDVWAAKCRKVDAITYMQVLLDIKKGDDWKDLYRPEFFGEPKA